MSFKEFEQRVINSSKSYDDKIITYNYLASECSILPWLLFSIAINGLH